MSSRKREHSIHLSDSDMSDEEPASKRLKSFTPEAQSNMSAVPETIIDVHADGDTLLVVKGMAGVERPISIRVSSHALCMGSTVFKHLLTESSPPSPPNLLKTLHLLDDDGDSILLLCNILHLRNNVLPTRIQPMSLLAFVRTAVKYKAIVAASRSTTPWLDHIYNSKTLTYSDPILIFKMLEASYLLDDPIYFARFSTRWVLQQTLGQTVDKLTDGGDRGRKRLAAELIARQKDAINTLKVDLDLIADSCAEAFADDNKHFVDCAPGTEPEPDDLPQGVSEPENCTTDKDGATEFLSALRDANVWPATRWPNSISAIIASFESFRIPEFDSSDACYWCIHVEDKFATTVGMVQSMHKERLWGLCLDCFRSGGLFEGECRLEHWKAKTVDADVLARGLSASVQSSRDGQAGGWGG